MPTLRAGTGLHGLPYLLLENIAPVGGLTSLRIDVREDVLKNGFLVTQKLAGSPVELPQDTRLADGEHHSLIADIHEHSLIHLVEVQRLAGHMLEVPDELAIV